MKQLNQSKLFSPSLIVGIIFITFATLIIIVSRSNQSAPIITDQSGDGNDTVQSENPASNNSEQLPDSGSTMPSPTPTTLDSTPTTPAPESISPSVDQAPTPSQSNYDASLHGSSAHSSCLHYEAGRCWDDLEDEAYSTGLYDRQNGYYGASVYYDDDCDSICQDILDDAYDEGWYDYH